MATTPSPIPGFIVEDDGVEIPVLHSFMVIQREDGENPWTEDE